MGVWSRSGVPAGNRRECVIVCVCVILRAPWGFLGALVIPCGFLGIQKAIGP